MPTDLMETVEDSAVENVTVTMDGTKMIVEIDTTVDLGASKSGKTRLCATTRGAVLIPETGITLNLNAYR